jgi:putative endonuclease
MRYFALMIYGGYVYILMNRHRTVLYVGVTAAIFARMEEHRSKINQRSFTARYNIDQLVYYEFFNSIKDAIDREKQIKKYSRAKKIALIRSKNSEMKDLSQEVLSQ